MKDWLKKLIKLTDLKKGIKYGVIAETLVEDIKWDDKTARD